MARKKGNSNAMTRRRSKRGEYLSLSVFELLKLPQELRLRIYELTLAAPNQRLGSFRNVRIHASSKKLEGPQIRDKMRFNVSLLLTSHQVRTEALPILYKVNNFHFTIQPVQHVDLYDVVGALDFNNTFTRGFHLRCMYKYLRSISMTHRSEFPSHSPIMTLIGDAMLAQFVSRLSEQPFGHLERLEIYLQAGDVSTAYEEGCALNPEDKLAPLTAAALTKFIRVRQRAHVKIGFLSSECIVCCETEAEKKDFFVYGIAPSTKWIKSECKGSLYRQFVCPPLSGESGANPCRMFRSQTHVWMQRGDPIARALRDDLDKARARDEATFDLVPEDLPLCTYDLRQ